MILQSTVTMFDCMPHISSNVPIVNLELKIKSNNSLTIYLQLYKHELCIRIVIEIA